MGDYIKGIDAIQIMIKDEETGEYTPLGTMANHPIIIKNTLRQKIKKKILKTTDFIMEKLGYRRIDKRFEITFTGSCKIDKKNLRNLKKLFTKEINPL